MRETILLHKVLKNICKKKNIEKNVHKKYVEIMFPEKKKNKKNYEKKI